MSKVRHRPGSIEPQDGVSPVRAGLTAGSVAAIAAVLVNLPLEAPTDTYFNSAPVMAGSLAVGLGAGVLWRALDGRGRRPAILLVSMTLAFGLVAVMAVAGETQMERSVSYIVPLAAIVFGLTGALTLLLLRARVSLPRWGTALIVLLAIGLGIALAGQGDQESGRLELPPRTTSYVILDSAPPH